MSYYSKVLDQIEQSHLKICIMIFKKLIALLFLVQTNLDGKLGFSATKGSHHPNEVRKRPTGIAHSSSLMDKTMNDKLTQNYPFCRLKLVVETYGYLTIRNNHSKFN